MGGNGIPVHWNRISRASAVYAGLHAASRSTSEPAWPGDGKARGVSNLQVDFCASMLVFMEFHTKQRTQCFHSEWRGTTVHSGPAVRLHALNTVTGRLISVSFNGTPSMWEFSSRQINSPRRSLAVFWLRSSD